MADIKNNEYLPEGLYFTCESATSELEFMEVDMNTAQRKGWTNKKVGYLGEMEFDMYAAPESGRNECGDNFCQGTPFVALKVTASNNEQQSITCKPVAQNIEHSLQLQTGFADFGFTAK